MSLDLERLSLAELIKLQQDASSAIRRRFERNLALAFTDLVGSTAYFQKFGDEAGRGLQQRHIDLLHGIVDAAGGRIVDTAGDGAFTCFPSVQGAVSALIDLQRGVEESNRQIPGDHQMSVRAGVHWGPVLVDGETVCGDSVNLCARVTDVAGGFEIVLTREAFLELGNEERLRCRPIRTVELEGILRPVEVMRLLWRDGSDVPVRARLEETGELFDLPPDMGIITFGRLRTQSGLKGNDVVLRLEDPELSKHISRWHFELRRRDDGIHIRPVSRNSTVVDGVPMRMDQDAVIRPGTRVELGGVATLTFLGDSPAHDAEGDPTFRGRTVVRPR